MLCAVLQIGQEAAGSATIYPSFTFPKPADKLPVFTLPVNTNTPAPSAAVATNYAFTCLVTAQPPPQTLPFHFEVRMQLLLGLSEPPALQTIPSSSSRDATSFAFIFGTDAAAAALSTQLQELVLSDYSIALHTLQVRAISYSVYTPQAASPAGGLGTGAIAGIASGGAVVLGLALFVVFRIRRSTAAGRADGAAAGSAAINSGGSSGYILRSMTKISNDVGSKYGAL